MFDAHKHGSQLVLTDAIEDEFGVAFLPPALTHLIGFGHNGVKMNFDVNLDTKCSATKFMIHFGGKRACLFKRTGMTEKDKVDNERVHNQIKKYSGPPGRWVVVPVPLDKPCFDVKPIPWPKDPNYPLDKLEKPIRPDFVDPEPEGSFTENECDGISMALIGGGAAPGIYVASEDELLYREGATAFSGKEQVTVRLEYFVDGDDQYVQFFVDDVPLTREPIFFTMADLAEGSKWAPKISLMAATSHECPSSHSISKVYFNMEEVLVGSQCESFKELVCKKNPSEEEEEALFMLNSELVNFVEAEVLVEEIELVQKEQGLHISAGVVGGLTALSALAILVLIVFKRGNAKYVPL
jgi:hypothetical protein